MKAKMLAAVLVVGAAGVVAPAAGADGEGVAAPVVVLELFTSQGCYSCPPAEELLAAEYAGREGVLALELHVDYWNDLVYGLAGSWEDPFSRRAFSERQFAYNRRIRRQNGGFTPQAIVHGYASAAGARKAQIDRAIAGAQADGGAEWRFSRTGDGGWRARISGSLEPGARLFYAVFTRRTVTDIPSGENKGKTLTNTNVVTVLENRGLDGGRSLSLPKIAPSQDCAVWAQSGIVGRILSAARCPAG